MAYSLIPAMFPFWKGENFGQQFPETIVVGDAFLGCHDIPAISL
jgi:hypothetical protein